MTDHSNRILGEAGIAPLADLQRAVTAEAELRAARARIAELEATARHLLILLHGHSGIVEVLRAELGAMLRRSGGDE